MSVRGTITSRTMVSPRSKTEWIICRSPDWISSLFSARSTSSRSSASVANGPSSKPLPGVRALPTKINNRGNGPSTVVSSTSGPATAQATRSWCCWPERARRHAPEHVRDDDHGTGRDQHPLPGGGEDAEHHQGDQHDGGDLAHRADEQRRVQVARRILDDPSHPQRHPGARPRPAARPGPGRTTTARPRRRPSARPGSTRTSATPSWIQSVAFTATAPPARGAVRSGRAPSRPGSCPSDRTSRPVARGPSWSKPSRCSSPCTSRYSASAVGGSPVLGGLPGGHGRAEHDVAEQTLRRLVVVVRRPQLVHRERQHVGRTGLAHVLLVVGAHRLLVDAAGSTARPADGSAAAPARSRPAGPVRRCRRPARTRWRCRPPSVSPHR